MIGQRILFGIACAIALTGCASAHYVSVKEAATIGPCQTTVAQRDLLLGVALSGGGSRAALFAQAGLEALSQIRMADGNSLLSRVDYLSSVSGGSLSASYYVLKKPGRDVPVLNPDGSLSQAYRTFFDQYRTQLSQDFETSLIWRQLLSFRWLNSALAAKTLVEVLAEKLYGDARIQDLAARAKAGDTPELIINTTLYNNGRRLALTTLPAETFQYDFFTDLDRSLERRGQPNEPAPYIRERWKLLWPMTPIDLHIDACQAAVAGAATASASFAPLIGPTTFRIGEKEEYWHVGDGGLYENSGVETLLLLDLKQLQAKRAKRALVIALDSSFPFSVGEQALLKRSLPFSLLNFDFTRIPSIMEERALTYQALFYRTLQLEGVFPDSNTITIVWLRHTDVKWAEDLSDVPASCKAEGTLKTPKDVDDRTSAIPTRLGLASECDRDLIYTAALKLVAENKDAILRFLNQP